MMTGRYAFRHGVGGVMSSETPGCVDPVPEPGEMCAMLLDEEILLPELLRDGFVPGIGFTSGAFGKYHLSYWTPDLRRQLEPHDVLLAVGMNLFRLYIHAEPENPIPQGTRIVHLDSHAWEIGKNYPVELGVLCDQRAGLEELATSLRQSQTPAQKVASANRRNGYEQKQKESRRALQLKIAEQSAQRPMTPRVMMSAIA